MCEAVVALQERARASACAAREEYELLAALPDTPDRYVAELKAAEEDRDDKADVVDDAESSHKKASRRANRKASADAAVVLETARAALQRSQRSCEDARSLLVQLQAEHFPEIAHRDDVQLGAASAAVSDDGTLEIHPFMFVYRLPIESQQQC